MASSIIDLIHINPFSATPKYQQIINSIIKAIDNGSLQIGDKLPSLSECYINYDISKDSVEKSYRHLMNAGIIKSVPKKGYYISRINRTSFRIFFLFNKLSEFKKIIYDSFVNAMDDNVLIDIGVYNNDYHTFKKLLKDHSDYSHIIIIPHFNDEERAAFKIINAIPKDKLIILDRALPTIQGDFITVCQNFKKDIYEALLHLNAYLRKYKVIKLIFTDGNYFPNDILEGFTNFCQDKAFDYEVVSDLTSEPINKGEVFICLTDHDLVLLIEYLEESDLKIGEHIGLISYNESSIKKLLKNGITTISTDFSEIGKNAASLIKKKEIKKIEVPFKIKLRASL